MAGRPVGLDVHGCRQLASGDLAVAPARRAALRNERRASARHESAPPYFQYAAAVRLALPDDGGTGPEYIRRWAVRRPSAACGIRGVDFGTKRRSEHAVLAAHHVGLCGIRPQARAETVLADASAVRAGPDGEADAGDAAVCAAAARLLAPATGA